MLTKSLEQMGMISSLKNKMVISKKILLIGIGVAALYWVLEAFVMSFIFEEGSVVGQIFTPNAHEVWMRSVGIGVLLSSGFYGQIVLAGRKRAKERLQTTHRFLEIANRHREMAPLLEDFVSAIKDFTGCQAVGLRILDKDGYIPYQSYKGFDRQFYEKESPLSIKSDQCMCIDVIKGKADSRLPYHTESGSFYSNGTTRFLATVPEGERGMTRNTCNQYGYESVALIPIRLENRILGLIHVADSRENMVPLHMVKVLESIALEMGTATQRIQAENDIVQSKVKMEALRVSEKMKSELLSLVSHELRTPLTAIKGFANTLLQPDVIWSEKESRDFISEIDGSADRLLHLVNDLLDNTYIEAGMLKLYRENCQITEILRPSYEEFVENAGRHKLQMDIPPVLPTVFVDKARIIQVVSNLVDNAAKFSKGEGVISIKARPNGNSVVISVADAGMGIKEELLDKIFDRFYQGDSAITGWRNGIGLGLSICKGIVKAHGGEIWVASEVGKGTEFSFSLLATRDGK
jgi:signal transduction histidine kinase